MCTVSTAAQHIHVTIKSRVEPDGRHLVVRIQQKPGRSLDANPWVLVAASYGYALVHTASTSVSKEYRHCLPCCNEESLFKIRFVRALHALYKRPAHFSRWPFFILQRNVLRKSPTKIGFFPKMAKIKAIRKPCTHKSPQYNT